jgi:hypothetical protein
MNKINCKFILLTAAILIVAVSVKGQTTMPEELSTKSLKEQIKYIEEHTRIYENYRAVREDIFQKINGNVIDSASAAKNKIAELDSLISGLNETLNSLNTKLETTTSSLNEMTATKNSISILGMEVKKVTYNSITWLIIIVLVTLLVIGILAFKRNLYVTKRTVKELNDLKTEFEAYRQSARIAREKLQMDHFNEIKKLKAK